MGTFNIVIVEMATQVVWLHKGEIIKSFSWPLNLIEAYCTILIFFKKKFHVSHLLIFDKIFLSLFFIFMSRADLSFSSSLLCIIKTWFLFGQIFLGCGSFSVTALLSSKFLFNLIDFVKGIEKANYTP